MKNDIANNINDYLRRYEKKYLVEKNKLGEHFISCEFGEIIPSVACKNGILICRCSYDKMKTAATYNRLSRSLTKYSLQYSLKPPIGNDLYNTGCCIYFYEKEIEHVLVLLKLIHRPFHT